MNFVTEMAEQPQALQALLSHWSGQDPHLNLTSDKPVVFLGMGSSYFAGLYGAWLLNRQGVPAVAVEASMAMEDARALLSGAGLWVLVSQSGESPEVLELAKEANGRNVLGVTNETNSYLARCSFPVVMLDAGHETATTSKTYLNTLAVMALLAGVSLESLAPLPDQIAGLLHQPMVLPSVPHDVTLIGRGPSLTSAYQGALILREGANITATGFSGAGFRHGPLQWAYDRDLILFSGWGRYRVLQEQLYGDLVQQGNRIYQLGMGPTTWSLPVVPDDLLPLLEIILIERLLVSWAIDQGIEPGKLVHKVSRE